MTELSTSQFQANDRWVSVGDSLSQPGFYQNYIQLYYLTRFPERKLCHFNGGISGDTAQKVLKRFEKDVLVYQPSVLTLLLGTNDMVTPLNLYESGKSGPEIEDKRTEAKQIFKKDLHTLFEKIQKTGARLIVLNTSIYDETVVHPDAAPVGKGLNSALDWCAEIIPTLASEFGAEVIDIHHPICRWNAELQKNAPDFTLTCLDRNHLSEVGHFVIAYEFLKAQGVPRFVSRIGLDAKSGESYGLVNVHVENLQHSERSITFDCLENALPYPISPLCKQALEFLPFVWELNQETLQIANLPTGNYELRIDGNAIASYTDKQLSRGVNLAMESATPQFQQAQIVLEMATRLMLANRPLRCFAEMECCFLADYTGDINDLSAVTPFLYAKVELEKGQVWYDYCKGQADTYMETKPQAKEFRAELDRLQEEVYRVNIPIKHHFSITAI